MFQPMDGRTTHECIDQFKKLIETGQNSFSKNNLDEAETTFGQALVWLNRLFAINLCSIDETRYRKSELDEALECIKRAVHAAPDFYYVYYLMAVVHFAQNESVNAELMCLKALDLKPNFVNAHLLLAQISLPGPIYQEILKKMHEFLRPRTYLEIGVASGDTLAYATGKTLAIGVDPSPKIDQPLNLTTMIYPQTSDDFFNSVDIKTTFDGCAIEMAYIDGMHQFEFALRDFINIEKNCYLDSVVLVHDCYPLNELTASRDRVTEFWSGDVWKLILCLKEYRPDLRIHVIGTSPTGLALINNLNPHSDLLTDHLESIYRRYIPMKYEILDQDKCRLLNYINNDWSLIESILVSSGALKVRHTH
jgi:hypothetical protein